MNIQQRVFDALATAKDPASLPELAALLPFDAHTVRQALERLRQLRCVRSECVEGVWRWRIRRGAARPEDRRGRA